MTSPTQRSLAHLKKNGYTAGITEHWNPFANIRQDLFGFLDLVAMHPDQKGLLGIQTTSTAHLSDHQKKIMAEPRAELWLKTGNRLVLWGWSKKGDRGKVKHWTLTERIIGIDPC